MRYTYLAPLALGAIALACNDGPTSPDNDLQLAGGGSNLSLTATQTATGLLERRVEYDWTGQRYVKEIHVGSDMHLIPERDRVQILVRRCGSPSRSTRSAARHQRPRPKVCAVRRASRIAATRPWPNSWLSSR